MTLPPFGQYATGMIFSEKDPAKSKVVEERFSDLAMQLGLQVNLNELMDEWRLLGGMDE